MPLTYLRDLIFTILPLTKNTEATLIFSQVFKEAKLIPSLGPLQ